MGRELIRLKHTAVSKEVVVSLLQERVAVVACLDCVVITSTRRQFDFSESEFDIETESNSVEPLRFNCVVTLLVLIRSRLHA